MHSSSKIEDLIGKKIKRIFASQDYLTFETDDGLITYTVEGECCSYSVFYDFIGVRKLLDNGAVISANEIELGETDLEKSDDKYCDQKDKNGDHESVSVYGFEIVTEDPRFGKVTSVFSFRNYSNGYYGGSMSRSDDHPDLPELTEDTIYIPE